MEFLGGSGIEAVPYKGPMLAVQAYGDIGLREFMDLDILVRHREIPKITEVMRENGYPLFTGSGGSKEKKGAEAIPGQYHFAKPPEFLPIEFHTEKTLRYYPSPIDMDRFLEHLTPVDIWRTRYCVDSILNLRFRFFRFMARSICGIVCSGLQISRGW